MYTVKYRPNGSIERYKVRLIAKRFIETHRINYLKTFSHIAMLITIWILLSLAANLSWNLQQFDVKNTFLH